MPSLEEEESFGEVRKSDGHEFLGYFAQAVVSQDYSLCVKDGAVCFVCFSYDHNGCFVPDRGMVPSTDCGAVEAVQLFQDAVIGLLKASEV